MGKPSYVSRWVSIQFGIGLNLDSCLRENIGISDFIG